MAEKQDEDVNKLITAREEPTNASQETSNDDQLSEELVHGIREWVKTCDKVSILAAGKTGAGKSTLLNAITGTDFFKRGKDRSQAGTKTITSYSFQKYGVTVTAWDSPGFQDDSGNEEVYKKELRENCSEVDLLMYCISMKDERADIGQDGSAFKQITEALTKEIWKRSIIVLTFANKLESRLNLKKVPNLEESFNEKMQQWKVKVQDALRVAEVDENVIKKIRVVPAGHAKRQDLPGHQYWLSKLWVACADVTSEEARISLSKLNQDRLTTEENLKPGDFLKDIHKQPIVIPNNAVLATGAVAGIAIGGTTGALIGGLALGVPTLGIGVGVGLALGFAIGGGLGVGTAGVITVLAKKIREKRRSTDSEST